MFSREIGLLLDILYCNFITNEWTAKLQNIFSGFWLIFVAIFHLFVLVNLNFATAN
jgi:hypothetical protein